MANVFGKVQKLGKALMLPVAVLPAAALLLRLGAPDVFNIPFIFQAGGAIFDNLALIFAVGIAVGFAFDNGGAAGLAGAVGYLVLTRGVGALNADINMGVLAGIVSGITAGVLYNKYHNIRLPDYLGFFGGKRFVPIATAVVSIVLAFLFGYGWPYVQTWIDIVGKWIVGAGMFGAFVFGFLNRLLIPLGLHHILNSMCWFVFGSFTDVAGKVFTGDLNRYFAGDPTAGMFMTGFFPIMMFALPAAALAMLKAAKPENRKRVSGILISMAFTAFLTGITEPIEFTFMFLAPVLYFAHAILTGTSLAICQFLGIRLGFGFSAGAIDAVLAAGKGSNVWMIVPIGLLYGVIYYFLFLWIIRRLDLPTPGRHDEMTADMATATGGDVADQSVRASAVDYLKYLGGSGNIEALDSCITRLRLTVKDPSKIDEPMLKRTGAMAVIRSEKSVQVVVGTRAELIASEMGKLIGK